MSAAHLPAKLGLNVFKPASTPHISIRPGQERDRRLRVMTGVCPAGCYTPGENGAVVLNTDGCLECGACRLVCGPEVLAWRYPEGGTGVQYRYG